jgi:hypothetical protein
MRRKKQAFFPPNKQFQSMELGAMMRRFPVKHCCFIA